MVIQLRDVRKSYPMGETTVHALAGVDLELEAGCFVAILGPSGSGKSTLLHLVGGLDQPTSGDVLVDGQKLEDLDEIRLAKFRRDRVGFVFQAFNLMRRMSSLENVALPLRFAGIPPKERRARALQALAQVALTQRAHHRPAELSGGEQQRVAIARALVNQPDFILADEPTGNLDSHVGRQIMELLAQQHHCGRTVLVATHDPRMAAIAERRLYLLDGQVAPEGDDPTLSRTAGESNP